MPMYEEPVVGAFYENEDGRTFEVLSFDENDGTIKIQYSDNTHEQFDLDDWYDLNLERVDSEDSDEDALDEPDDTGMPVDDDDLGDGLDVDEDKEN